MRGRNAASATDLGNGIGINSCVCIGVLAGSFRVLVPHGMARSFKIVQALLSSVTFLFKIALFVWTFSRSSLSTTLACGVSTRLMNSASSRVPSVLRAATDQRFLDDVIRETFEVVEEPDIMLSAKFMGSVRRTGSATASDALIACCNSRIKVGDSSRAS